MSHLKRHAAPTTWTVNRKETSFMTSMNPGPHKKEHAMPLSIWMRTLGAASTAREVKKVLGEVTVDGRKVNHVRFPVGFQDILTIGKESYQITFKQGKLEAEKTTAKEKTASIKGKTKIKGKTQLNMSDGRNILVEKDEYKVGDSLVLSVPDQKIVKHVKLAPGVKIVLIGGKHAGTEGVMKEIKGNTITYEAGGKAETTLKKYAYALA
ncbi:30S ribosomal protein S4e [Candidatus Woesearchaeota archaeon]|nr:30S ribosomal protein S4e [Candidatus Woesearchaeota archaeon]|tara:strand:+ start:318 stop:944 length:627 start_codon:yes stop_codon:yes gene_type:complete